MWLYVLSFVWKKLGKIFVKIPYLFPRKITLYQLNYIPWIWRIFNGFLTIFSPSPQIRRNYLSSLSAVCSCWCRNTNNLFSLVLPAAITHTKKKTIYYINYLITYSLLNSDQTTCDIRKDINKNITKRNI